MIEGKGAKEPRLPAAADPAGREASSAADEVSALRAENAALRGRLALQEQALDAMPTHFLIATYGASGPTIEYCNKVVADHHGLCREELLGKNVQILTQAMDANSIKIDTAELRSGKTLHHENEVTRPDGSKFWLGRSIRPLFDANGAMTHSVSLGADITAKREEMRKKQELQDKLMAEMQERERIAIELQLAQKLESVGRLAAGIAHEINTPIQYVGDGVYFLRSAFEDISQMLGGLRRAVEECPDDQLRNALLVKIAELTVQFDMEFLHAEIPKALERTLDGVERVTNIVKAMKEFAHPDANVQSPADLNHALQTTLLVASNEYKYIAKVHTEFAQIPEVMCNVGELNQVFLNLIVNAAHAIQDADKDPSTGEIKISTAVDGDAAIIRITDNGCGIPSENLAKVYDPFFTTKEVGRGTGQGLAISHSILVDKHGGDISVSSEVGVGTEFTLRLPIAGRAALTN
ncbi:MAG: ATP-binding protein [Pseudomonadota bacterium]|nr:ATP-binding protein [Pseudomonadota bacterium]